MAKKEEEKSIVPLIQKQTAPFVKMAASLEVKDEKSKAEAATVLNDLKQLYDKVVAYKEAKTKPLNQALKVIRDETRELEANLKTAIDATRAKLNAYQTEALRLARIEEDKIAARVGDGRGHLKPETAIKKIDELDKPSASVAAGSGEVKFRTVRKLVIDDYAKVYTSIIEQKAFHVFSIHETALLNHLKDGNAVAGARIEEVQEAASHR